MAALALMGHDKRSALRARRRVRERSFALLSLLGGWPGVAVGMLAFRHKTRSLGFQAKVVAAAAAHAAVAALVWRLEP
jgi:uncharacterized membrane protein YsdA (DUF1294 family)